MDFKHLFGRCALLVPLLALAACSSSRPWVNLPLAAGEKIRYDGMAQAFDKARLQDMLVVANFSGGGSRAAALAYVVVSELDKQPFTWRGQQTTLARELDMVTGVSGGAVAAAHIALHGIDEHLRHFPADFLDVNFQNRVVNSLITHLGRTSSPFYGRGHVLAEKLDGDLFRGATFGDLAKLENRPYLVIAATDLSSGAEFDFTAEQFEQLCSSIDRVPIAFAVASSSAVPVLFTPLAVQSHREDCGRQVERPGRAATGVLQARKRELKGEAALLADDGRKYIHLVDGGVADNLGTTRISNFVDQVGGLNSLLARLRLGKDQGSSPRRIVFISVNAERREGLALDQSNKVPGAVSVINAMLYSGLGRQTEETSQVFSDAVEKWREELGHDSGVEIFDLEIKISELGEAGEERERLLAIPTAFRISEEDIALLRQATQRSLAESPEFQRFLASTK